MVHTFSTDSKEKKEHVVELVRSLMNKWHTGILEKQRYGGKGITSSSDPIAKLCTLTDPLPLARRETEEVKEQFKGLTFKILFTVPVHSSTEKEFIVRTSLFSKTALVKMKK
jgi:hypothetical protein